MAGVSLALPHDVRIEELVPAALGRIGTAAPEASVRPTVPTVQRSDEYSLERVVAQRSLRTSGDARTARLGTSIAVVNPLGTFFARSGVLLSAAGSTAELEMMRVVPLGLPSQAGWLRIRSADQVILQARAGAFLLPIALTAQELVTRGSALLGFDEALLRGAVANPSLPDAGLINLIGNGTVVLESRAELRSLPVLPGRTTTVAPTRLLGWWGRIRIESCSDAGDQEGLVALRGQGAVVIDSASEVSV